MLRLSCLAALLATCTACSQFPELDNTVPKDAARADYPELVPFDSLTRPAVSDITPQANLQVRSAALRARAARLRATVIDGQTRQRMSDGVPQS